MPDFNPSAFNPDFLDPNSPLTLLTSTSQNNYRIMTASLLATLPTTLTHPNLPAFPPGTDFTLNSFPSNNPHYYALPRNASATDFIEPLPAINYKLLHPLINICNPFLSVEARERVNEVAKVRELYYKVHERLMGLKRRLEAAVAWRKMLHQRQEAGAEGAGTGEESGQQTRMMIIRNEFETRYLIVKLRECVARRAEITARFGGTKKAFLEKDMPKLVLLGRWIMGRNGWKNRGLSDGQPSADVVADGDTGPHGIVFNGDQVPHGLKSTTNNEAPKDRMSSYIQPVAQQQSNTSALQTQPLGFTTRNHGQDEATVQEPISRPIPFGPSSRSYMGHIYAGPESSHQLGFPPLNDAADTMTNSNVRTSNTHTHNSPFCTGPFIPFDHDGNPITSHQRPTTPPTAEDEADDGIIPHHIPTISTSFPPPLPITDTNSISYPRTTEHDTTTTTNAEEPEPQEPTNEESLLDEVMPVNLPDPTTTAAPAPNDDPSETQAPPFTEHESFFDAVMSVDLDGMTFPSS